MDTNLRLIQALARDLKRSELVSDTVGGDIPYFRGDELIPFSLLTGTRGYIERVVHQINGCYADGWYDACLVMVRRLLETLIIEVFEANHLANEIKASNGEYLYLGDLISRLLGQSSWNIGRTAKGALPRFKNFGDSSAHGRRFNAQKSDISPFVLPLRAIVQELVYLAGWK